LNAGICIRATGITTNIGAYPVIDDLILFLPLNGGPRSVSVVTGGVTYTMTGSFICGGVGTASWFCQVEWFVAEPPLFLVAHYAFNFAVTYNFIIPTDCNDAHFVIGPAAIAPTITRDAAIAGTAFLTIAAAIGAC
jgi:hypothetical protein